jgi:hypothetical protein
MERRNMTTPTNPEPKPKTFRVPWGFVARHERQCLRNHDQGASRLAERGGLGVREMISVVTDQCYRECGARFPDELSAVGKLKELVAEYDAANQPERAACSGGGR